MKISINNRDCTATVGLELQEALATIRNRGGDLPRQLPPHISALSLATAKNEAEYGTIFRQLIRMRDAVGMHNWRPHPQPGPLGKLKVALYSFFWKMTRTQSERMIFRQNLINSQLTAALGYEAQERQRELDELRAKVEALETKLRDTRAR